MTSGRLYCFIQRKSCASSQLTHTTGSRPVWGNGVVCLIAYSEVTAWSQEVEAFEGATRAWRARGFVGEGADTYAGGVSGATLVEAVAVGEKQEGLRLRSDAS